MSDNVNCEESETKSYEYCLKWNRSMYPRYSSRLAEGSKNRSQESSAPKEEVTQRGRSGQGRTTWQTEAKAGDSLVDTDESRDIIDLIDDAVHVAEEDRGEAVEITDRGLEELDVEITDRGLDESDEDCGSVSSSIASGPSSLYHASPKKPSPSQSLCSACRQLCQKAKRLTAPTKDKLLDVDPKSLTCDEWVLIKKWTPRRLPNARGKLLRHLQLVKKVCAKRSKQCVEEGEASACSRPHAFLQRNLRWCVQASAKKERKQNRRKRRRNDSPGSRAAKQQRLHSSNDGQHTTVTCTDDPSDCHSSSPNCEGCSNHETDEEADPDLTFDFTPSSVTLETTKPRQTSPRQEAPKKPSAFRDLLAQLRGNSSIVVKETC